MVRGGEVLGRWTTTLVLIVFRPRRNTRYLQRTSMMSTPSTTAATINTLDSAPGSVLEQHETKNDFQNIAGEPYDGHQQSDTSRRIERQCRPSQRAPRKTTTTSLGVCVCKRQGVQPLSSLPTPCKCLGLGVKPRAAAGAKQKMA